MFKIVDKSRYDDEKEEWIIPYSKKKSLESIESKNNNNSLLPDINKSSYLNKVSLGLISNNEKQNNEKDHFKSLSTAKGFGLIPLLNLPGIIIFIIIIYLDYFCNVVSLIIL